MLRRRKQKKKQSENNYTGRKKEFKVFEVNAKDWMDGKIISKEI